MVPQGTQDSQNNLVKQTNSKKKKNSFRGFISLHYYSNEDSTQSIHWYWHNDKDDL